MLLDDPTTGLTSRVCVLMAVRNGAAYLPAQLDSLAAQIGINWTLIASDDGSQDQSLDILRGFAAHMGADRVQVLQGPKLGVVENFRFLLTHAPAGQAIAFADQDDIWFPDKLRNAIETLRKAAPGRAALYGSSVILADANGQALASRWSPVPRRPLSFCNAMVQNVFQGNTIVLNPVAADLLVTVDRRLRYEGIDYVLHDWWAYLLVSGSGGVLLYDARPGLLYRQHSENVIGANAGFGAMVHRFVAVMAGRNQGWMDKHLRALDMISDLLTRESHALVRDVADWRQGSVVKRVLGLWRSGLYMQSRRANLGLWFAALLGKV